MRAVVGVGLSCRRLSRSCGIRDRLRIGCGAATYDRGCYSIDGSLLSFPDGPCIRCSARNKYYVAATAALLAAGGTSLAARRESVRQWRITRYTSVTFVAIAEPRHDMLGIKMMFNTMLSTADDIV